MNDTAPLHITVYQRHADTAAAISTTPTTLNQPSNFRARFVRLQPDVDVLVEVGTMGQTPSDPTAASFKVPANSTEYIQLDTSGSPVKVMTASGTGNVNPVWCK